MEIELTPEQIKYLAQLVDLDTTGNQDDPLYLQLIEVWNACDDGDVIVLRVEHGVDDNE